MIDKVYIITLDQSDSNKESILNRLNTLLNIETTYQFIDAVDGRKLFKTIEGRESYGIRFYSDWNNGESEWWSRPVTSGEAGGMCSHIRVWEDAYRNGYDNILIVEDDFNPTRTFDFNLINEVSDYDILFLSRILQSVHMGVYDTDIQSENFVIPGYSYQTHSYLLSKSGIRKLVETNLDTLKKNIIVSDEFLPATYTWHPRKDIRDMFIRNMKAYAYKENFILQDRFEAAGNSLTSPIEGIDY